MFAKRLNKTRKDRGITAQQMADKLNTGIRNYRKYESGDANPTLEGITAISNILEVSADYLLGIGIFADWEEIMENRDMVTVAIETHFPEFKKYRLHDMNEQQLMTILPAFISQVEFKENNEVEITYFI